MAARAKYPVKLSGVINWMFGTDDDARGVTVKRAILRSKDEIVLDFTCEGYSYIATLKRVGTSQFEGSFDAQVGSRLSTGTVSASLYSNDEGQLLIGKWLEDGYESLWWAELERVEHFDDEAERAQRPKLRR